jgi:hypothetical protein
LKLLSSDLLAVTIEAASSPDTANISGDDAGTEVIDIAEYYAAKLRPKRVWYATSN